MGDNREYSCGGNVHICKDISEDNNVCEYSIPDCKTSLFDCYLLKITTYVNILFLTVRHRFLIAIY